MSNLAPTFRMEKTILASARELQLCTGRTPAYDPKTTLNTLYNVFPSLLPIAPQYPTIQYFGIGINGFTNINDSNLSQPNEVSSTDMNLYTQIPFRCVPVEQDLTPTERAQYRLRVLRTINGNDYYCYYLKMITYNDSAVQITQTDPTTNLQKAYVVDYSNLTPTVPTSQLNGVISSSTTEVNTTVSANLPVTGAEVVEAISVLYNNLQYARVSEVGIYSGVDAMVTGTDANNNPITYTEAAFVQMASHYCYLGTDLSSTTSTYDFATLIGNGDVILLG